MKKILIICLFVLCSSGCAAALISGGVIGGVAIGKDAVKTGIDANYERVWNASIEEVKRVADIKLEDKKHGVIEAASISGEKVVVKVREITRNSCEIVVSSRKNLLPNISLAHEISNKILNRAK